MCWTLTNFFLLNNVALSGTGGNRKLQYRGNMNMGGPHHHKPPYVVPDYTIYKVEDAKELLKVQERLAKRGLKDPWLRNEVWRYSKAYGTLGQKIYSVLFRGFPWGLAAFVITLGVEKSLGITWDHDAHHEDHHNEHGKDQH